MTDMVAEGGRLQEGIGNKWESHDLNTSFLPDIRKPSTLLLLPFTVYSSPFKMGSSTKRADLVSISLAGLLEGNPDTVSELVSACKTNGFFYLDFRDASTEETLKQVDELVDVGNSVFKLPLEEKEEYSTEKHLSSRLQGYVLSTHSNCRTCRTDEEC